MACQRMCKIPGMGAQMKSSGFDSRVLATGREYSRELIPREYSRELIPREESRGSEMSGGSPRVTLHLPVDVQDAIITLVRKEAITIVDPLTTRVHMMQTEIDYMASRLTALQDSRGDGMGNREEDVGAIRDLVKQTTDAINIMAMHDCRLHETENNLQQLASLQRELAAKVQTQPESSPLNVSQNQNEMRLSKLESELTELHGQVARDRAAFANYDKQADAGVGTALIPPIHKVQDTRELAQIHGDQGCDIDQYIEKKGSQDTCQHEAWLADMLPAKECPVKDSLAESGGAEPLESSQIKLEEHSEKNVAESGVWYYSEGSVSHSYEILYKDGEYFFMQDGQSAEGALRRGPEWLEGQIELRSIRIKIISERRMLYQFKPNHATAWHEPVIASRDAPAEKAAEPSKAGKHSYFRLPRWLSSRGANGERTNR